MPPASRHGASAAKAADCVRWMSRLQLFDLRTSVTVYIRTSVTPELGRVLGREVEDDAMEEYGCGRAAIEVCSACGEWSGGDDRFVSRVRRVAYDGVSWAPALPASGQLDCGGRTQSPSSAQPVADRCAKRTAGGVFAAQVCLGREEVRSVAARRRPAAHADHDQPDFEAARISAEECFPPASLAAI